MATGKYTAAADSATSITNRWTGGLGAGTRRKKNKKKKDRIMPLGPSGTGPAYLMDPATGPTYSSVQTPKYLLDPAAGPTYSSITKTPTQIMADAYNQVATPPAIAPMRTPTPSIVEPYVGGQATGAANESPGDVPMDKWTGWAAESGFDADMLPYLYQDPSLISRQWLKEQGWSPESGRMASMGKVADLLELWSAATLGTGGVNTGNPDDFLNFADQIFSGMMDPGGKGVPDMNQMIQNILDAPEGSALKAFMESGEFGNDADTFNSLIRAASAMKTPFMQQAIENMLRTKTDEWMLANTRGRKDANGIADWFQKGGGGFFG